MIDDWVGVGEPIPRIAHASTGDGRTIHVTWTTGERVFIDLTRHIASHRAFARLRIDDAFFKKMQVGKRGDDIFWPEVPECAIPCAYLVDYAVLLKD